MMNHQANETLIADEPKPPGYISEKCRFYDESGTRFILVKDVLVYTFELTDKTALRQVAVSIYRSKMATQIQISQAWNLTNKTIYNWVRSYRKGGMAALVDKTRPGAPRKVTDAVKKQIRRCRRQRMSLPEICQITNLSYGAVCTVLYTKPKGEVDLFEENQDDKANLQSSNQTADNDEPAELWQSDDKIITDTLADTEIDPLDRWQDRADARIGLLQDAKPIFADCPKVEFAGSLMAVALLELDPYLGAAVGLFGQFKAAFYGVRTVFMTMLLMALLRIKTNEQINRYNPQKLGRILGLDRAPCVRTQRRKLRRLAGYNKAVDFMEKTAKERMADGTTEEQTAILYVDGHIYSYSGKFKIGKTFSATRNRVVKGTTDYWVNLAGGAPLLCVTTEFNDGMTTALPKLLKLAQKLCKGKRITLVFDRGGASHELYEKLSKYADIITYRKNPQHIDISFFKKQKTLINGKEYEYAPYVREVALNVYGKKDGKRCKTGRTVSLREIIIQRQDGGQTAILTTRRDLEPEQVASILFSRWSQENYFKYMIAEYNLDHLCVYGTEELSPDIDHPNPDYCRLEKNLKKIKNSIAAILSKDLPALTDEDLDKAVKQFQKVHGGKKGEKLHQLSVRAEQIRDEMKETPKRITPLDCKKLKSEARLLTNAVKIAAWHIETGLVKILAKYYKKTDQDGRATIVAMIKSSGALRVKENELHVTLEPQATPQKTELLRHLCTDLNARQAKFPGSNMTLKFDVAA